MRTYRWTSLHPAAPRATIAVADTDTADFSCPQCSRTFTSLIGLVGHLRIHRTETGAPTYTRRIRLAKCASAEPLASGLWWYYVSKLIELTDTAILILRKKSQQLTFLHVYHHVTMPFWCWIAVRWFCGGSTFFIPTINSFVHVVMYTYYGLAAFRPNWTLYLMYKHLLTVLQLVQFFICMLFGLTLLLVRCDFIPVQLVYVDKTTNFVNMPTEDIDLFPTDQQPQSSTTHSTYSPMDTSWWMFSLPTQSITKPFDFTTAPCYLLEIFMSPSVFTSLIKREQMS
ncbi:Elongation of very long chain fatty acids protein 4 [Sparganum proliferum]